MTPVVLDAVSLGAEVPKHRRWVECSCCNIQLEGGTKMRPCVHLKPLVARECHLPPEWRKYYKAVANETGDKNARPLSRFARSKSQNCLWNTIIGGLTGNLKERPKPTIISDPRPPEEILADELPPVDSPEALVKTSFRSEGHEFTLFILEWISF
ncbi:calcium/calmodulin-dependent 3',5'-cyclic nucleotide phosphodiesterase 1C-like [Grus japonensis]|uniref:Calcium/calmodulin-dependent 3',5'-cyclic nucleotide phosphodiesterase 1C-like n=1 Tax=Grus japonensis TaxID=30415 RepID=A0ABC9WFE9_GRUJA